MKDDHILLVDPEFQWLSPKLNEDAKKRLEASIMVKGCVEPIRTWNGVILDGYKRYEICHSIGIPFETVSLQFKNRYQAMSWICQQLLKNPDINIERKKYLTGKEFEAEHANFGRESQDSSYQLHGCKYLVAKSIAEKYNLAVCTIFKYYIYANNLDAIREKSKIIAEMILAGNLKISHESAEELALISAAQLHSLETTLTSDNEEHLTNSDIKCTISRSNGGVPQPKNIKHLTTLHQKDLPIKQVPKFDPDTELSSLMLTIPSWITIMRRVEESSYIESSTYLAKQQLKNKLLELNVMTSGLITKLGEYSL